MVRGISRFKSCSQTRKTYHPSLRNSFVAFLSRSWFSLIFSAQKRSFVLGLTPCSGQPCQKQPSTKMATFWLHFLSGCVLRPRMRLMLSRRCAGVSTSAISSCSGHLVSAASKGASGHNDASIRISLSNNFPRRFKRGRVACGRRDSDDDFRAVRAADFDLGRARLLCRADRPRNIGLRDCGRAAAHDCVSWAFMAKPSINSTLTIKFSVRHAIERFHYPRDQ